MRIERANTIGLQLGERDGDICEKDRDQFALHQAGAVGSNTTSLTGVRADATFEMPPPPVDLPTTTLSLKLRAQ
jgi:hypothetical protein